MVYYGTHALVLLCFRDKMDLTYQEWLVASNWLHIHLLECWERTPAMYEIVARQYGRILEREDCPQTPEICLEAVRQDGTALKYVINQTYDICLAAVQQNGLAIEFVREQTPEICLAAVKSCPRALKYIKSGTEEMILRAIATDSTSINHLRDTSLKVRLLALSKNVENHRRINNPTKEMYVEAIKQGIDIMKYVPDEYKELCTAIKCALPHLEAVKKIQWWYRDVTIYNPRMPRVMRRLLTLLDEMKC